MSSHLCFCGDLPAVFGDIFCFFSHLSEPSTLQRVYLGLSLHCEIMSGFPGVIKAVFPQRYRTGLNLTHLHGPAVLNGVLHACR